MVGGIVRSTGSGMGCPDWPTCFGLLVPPTDVSEIPAAFFEANPEYQAQEFNAFQTWVEYINRLIGVLIGLFTFATFLLSLGFFRKQRSITILSFSAMALTGFVAWLGKVVVDKHLEGGMVTLHMLGAILILSLLITAVYLADARTQAVRADKRKGITPAVQWMGIGILLISLAQILIGTQVREQVDQIAAALDQQHRETWVEGLNSFYALHRVLWILIAGAIVVWVRRLTSLPDLPPRVKLFAYAMLGFLFAEVFLGILLAMFHLPPVLQPLHLVLANLLFAAELAVLVYVLGIERFMRGKVNTTTDTEDVNQGQLANAEQ